MTKSKAQLVALIIGVLAMGQEAKANPDFGNLIRSLSKAEIGDHKSVEMFLQVQTRSSGGNASFSIWKGGGFRYAGITFLDVEYREPKPTSDATAGPLLIMRLADVDCISLKQVRTNLPELKLTGVPRDRPRPQISYSYTESDRSFRFGFAVNGDQCLQNLSLQRDR